MMFFYRLKDIRETIFICVTVQGFFKKLRLFAFKSFRAVAKINHFCFFLQKAEIQTFLALSYSIYWNNSNSAASI